MHYHIPSVVILTKTERETNQDDRSTREVQISEKGCKKNREKRIREDDRPELI